MSGMRAAVPPLEGLLRRALTVGRWRKNVLMTTRVLGLSTGADSNACDGWRHGETGLVCLRGTCLDIIMTWGGSHEP
jgi:hypothetical protein